MRSYFPGGSMVDKQKMIDQHVFQKFGLARSNFGRVHDIDLRRWAMEKGTEVYLISIEKKTFRFFTLFGFKTCSRKYAVHKLSLFILFFISSIGWSYYIQGFAVMVI